jgi:DNA-binding transcriptional ArsR family regulator
MPVDDADGTAPPVSTLTAWCIRSKSLLTRCDGGSSRLATGEHSAGTLSEIAFTELGVTRTAVSHQLRTLREHGVVWSTVDPVEPRSRSYRLNPAFLASLDTAVFALFELWEHRYGTAEGRAPLVPIPVRVPVRVPDPDPAPGDERQRIHRFGEAERRRRRDALAEWADGADAEL